MENELYGLIKAFDYIEGVRIWGVNKGKKRRLSKTRNADLYYSGKYIINIIQKYGNRKQNIKIQEIINKYEKHFIN